MGERDAIPPLRAWGVQLFVALLSMHDVKGALRTTQHTPIMQ